jgi:hypothetical protein
MFAVLFLCKYGVCNLSPLVFHTEIYYIRGVNSFVASYDRRKAQNYWHFNMDN